MPAELEAALRNNPVVSSLLMSWEKLALPDCRLVAGILVQSYWNAAHEFEPLHGVSDADIVYFEPGDLREESEHQHYLRIVREFGHLPVRFDVKNEARVHLWYEDRFGYAIRPYTSVEAAIDTFPTTAGSIGIRPDGESIACYATFGFDDLLELVVRPNKRQITRPIYEEKVRRWKSVWPLLRIIDWEDAQC